MSRISSVLGKSEKKALVGYLTVGYPDIETIVKAVTLLAENGCDIIELGIPFSDPLADGATIQRASHQALEQGVSPAQCLKVAAKIRQKVNTPLVFMTYYNPILHYGIERFCEDCRTAGVDGLIVPDLPPDEAGPLQAAAGKDVDIIYLLAPTSTDERIKKVVSMSGGFIYLVSITGVTGARQGLPPELGDFVARVRKQAKQPLCVGFGISSPEQAVEAATNANGVIIGSRLIQLIEEDKTLYSLRQFVQKVRKALDS